MSVTNNSVNCQTGSSANNVFHSHVRSSSGQWDRYNDQTDVHGYYSGVGSPEGVVAADTGSIYTDTGAGATGVYYKTTDTVNTGWQLFSSTPLTVVSQVFTANGTYTPTAGMQYCIVEMVGGGGAGGGAVATGAATFSVGGGGASGEYAYGVFSAATIGASQAVTIGAGGATAVGAAGGNGGTTSLGVLLTAGGGGGGAASAAGTSVFANGGAAGTGGAGGSLRYDGDRGFWGLAITASGIIYSGQGASNNFGSGGYPALFPATSSGSVGSGYGVGGSGAVNQITQAARAGSAGNSGVIQITEYVM
jgi:hypothetical protein